MLMDYFEKHSITVLRTALFAGACLVLVIVFFSPVIAEKEIKETQEEQIVSSFTNEGGTVVLAPFPTKSFTSEKLGVRLVYVESDGKILSVTEIGRRIYIHEAGQRPEKGEWVEVFDMPRGSNDFESAVWKAIMGSREGEGCLLEAINYEKWPDHYSVLILSSVAGTCPRHYSSESGYFLFNKNEPLRFAFIRLNSPFLHGRSTLSPPAASSSVKGTDRWDLSIELFKPVMKNNRGR
jgi:hypothetical protein